MSDPVFENRSRNLSTILVEIREELKDFVNTRVQMIKSEIRESMGAMRIALPLALLALILFGTAFLLISAAVVTLVASAFAGNPYAWFFACAIVGVLWLIFGGIAVFFAYNEIRSKGTFPKHTVEVLKADKDWIEAEGRTRYVRAA